MKKIVITAAIIAATGALTETSYVKAGTTFSCNIGNYGNGNCTIIVSSGNTVIYYKNINNR